MARQTKYFIGDIIRALRLPFVFASALPFVFGSMAGRDHFNALNFSLGLLTVLSAHLSANLINDYADSSTGADWQDKKFYKFFGGSKLIQEGVFSEGFYLGLALFFAVISALAAVTLSIIFKSAFIISVFLAVIFLGWSYSIGPLRFSYRRLGETVIFLLFGPAVVMSGYYLQTGVFPDIKSFMFSLPFGFLTAAILYANEIPDFPDDEKTGKFTLVSVFGRKYAYIFYCVLTFLAFFFIILNVILRYIAPASLFSLIFAFIIFRAAVILKKADTEKTGFLESSRLTIAAHTLVSAVLILAVAL